VDEVVEVTLRLSRRICQVCEVVIARQHFTTHRLILEGFWLLPEFAGQPSFEGIDMSGRVRSLFLYEADASDLEQRYLHRDGKVGLPDEQASRLAVFQQHGLAIKQQAEALGLPVLESRPFETLQARALEALGIGHP
jgi:2-phosphoglycerate kinase